jgi:hypothetical protein
LRFEVDAMVASKPTPTPPRRGIHGTSNLKSSPLRFFAFLAFFAVQRSLTAKNAKNAEETQRKLQTSNLKPQTQYENATPFVFVL